MANRLKSLFSRPKRPSLAPDDRGGRRVLGSALFVISLAMGFGFSLAGHARHLAVGFLAREITDFRCDVFLTDHADRSFLEERILTTPGVRSARFVTREEALGRAQDDPVLVESVKLASRNPLPESFEIVWDPVFLTPFLLGPVADKWASLDGVAQVGYDKSRLERLALLRRVKDELEAFLSILLWGASGASLLALGFLFFSRSRPLVGLFPWGAVLAGAAGGALGAAAAWGWVGAWEFAGVWAGLFAGFLGGLRPGHRQTAE